MNHLREKRTKGRLDVSYTNFTFELPLTESGSIETLKLIEKQLNENHRKNIRLAHHAGKILLLQKSKLHKENYNTFLKTVNYSKSWECFLIYIYELVEKYHGLQQCGVTLKYIRTNKKLLNEVLENNKEEWNNLV